MRGRTYEEDGYTPHWKLTAKGIAYTEGQRLASYEEAQMIIAEAAAMTNDLPRAITVKQPGRDPLLDGPGEHVVDLLGHHRPPLCRHRPSC